MQIGQLSVGTTPVAVPVATLPAVINGLRLLARSANVGNVFVGLTSAVTSATGNLVSKGDPGATIPYTITPAPFTRGQQVYLVADQANQVVDWSAD